MLVGAAVVLLASACGTTDGDTPFAPEVKPAFDGLPTGGNVAGGGTTGSTTTTETTTASDTTTTSGRGLPTGGN
jgi:hypothetical protein